MGDRRADRFAGATERTGAALAAFAVAPAVAGNHNPPDKTVFGVVLDVDVDTVVTEDTYMGQSQVAPPNDNAAASQGTRTEKTTTTTTTTTTGDVTGPPGQVDPPGNQEPNYDCQACSTSNVQETVVVETETEVIDEPGANR